jgi:hypothetical protein
VDALCAKLREARRNAPPDALWHRILPAPSWIVEAVPERPSRRERKPNVTTPIKSVRDAGERGLLRVEFVNDDGTRIIIASPSDCDHRANLADSPLNKASRYTQASQASIDVSVPGVG